MASKALLVAVVEQVLQSHASEHDLPSRALLTTLSKVLQISTLHCFIEGAIIIIFKIVSAKILLTYCFFDYQDVTDTDLQDIINNYVSEYNKISELHAKLRSAQLLLDLVWSSLPRLSVPIFLPS